MEVDVIDAHLIASLCVSDAALELLSLLPSTDLVCELEALIVKQYEVLIRASQGVYLPKDTISEVIADSLNLYDEASRIKEQQKLKEPHEKSKNSKKSQKGYGRI